MFWKTELCRNAWHWDIDSFPSIYITRCFLLSFSQDYVTRLSKQEHEEVYWQEELTFPLVITGCHIDGQVWKHHQSVNNKQGPAFSLPHALWESSKHLARANDSPLFSAFRRITNIDICSAVTKVTLETRGSYHRKIICYISLLLMIFVLNRNFLPARISWFNFYAYFTEVQVMFWWKTKTTHKCNFRFCLTELFFQQADIASMSNSQDLNDRP